MSTRDTSPLRYEVQRLTVAAFLAITTARAAIGQTGSLSGIATDIANHPLSGVSISLAPGSRSALSDSAGGIRIAAVEAGNYVLTARRVGFAPASATITIERGMQLDVDLELEAVAQRLTEVTVRADSARSPLWIAIERRNHSGAGNVLTPELLAENKGHSIVELLTRRARGATSVEYKGMLLLSSSRGQTSILGAPTAEPGRSSPRACYAQIYLDGARIYFPGSGQQVPNLGAYDAGQFEAVEFYPSAASAPVEYGGTGAQCGTLLLWTRSHL